MSARDRLWELYQTPDTASAFGDALDAFAHELAERIRNADFPAHATDGADYAADLIDPHAGPVRPDEEPTP